MHEKKLFKKSRHAESLCIINESLADLMAEKVSGTLAENGKSIVFELNPGLFIVFYLLFY